MNEIKRIERGGEAWGEADQIVEVIVKRPLDTVVPVRLTAATYAELRRAARERGVGPSTLIRMWLLERLRTDAKPDRTGEVKSLTG
ncbi:MAG: hypothetical protein ACREOS_11495 [Candidatus Dormibacteraceae bacterium]